MSYSANPRAEGDGRVVQEGTGQVMSDSLAAESLRSKDGQFAQNTPGAAASQQGSYGSTANTTDTSGASILGSAPDRPSRGDNDENPTYRTPAEVAGLSKDGSSVGSEYGSGGGAAYNTSKGGPQESYGGDAPSYATAGGDPGSQPKGKNLTEGGFSSDDPNASFNSNIGGRRDPGRVAERDMQASSARAAGDAGYSGAAQGYSGGQGGFENLERDERA